MEKKPYINPDMEVITIETSHMLTASDSVEVFDKTTEDDAVMSNRRRGSWGNLWDDDEKE